MGIVERHSFKDIVVASTVIGKKQLRKWIINGRYEGELLLSGHADFPRHFHKDPTGEGKDHQQFGEIVVLKPPELIDAEYENPDNKGRQKCDVKIHREADGSLKCIETINEFGKFSEYFRMDENLPYLKVDKKLPERKKELENELNEKTERKKELENELNEKTER